MGIVLMDFFFPCWTNFACEFCKIAEMELASTVKHIRT